MLKRTLLAAVAALAAPVAMAQPAPNPNFIRAIMEGLSPETRAEVERRATAGNHPYEVMRIILLNNMQLANVIQAGEPPLSEVVAIDFIREHAVFRQGSNLRVINFDAKTLRFKQ